MSCRAPEPLPRPHMGPGLEAVMSLSLIPALQPNSGGRLPWDLALTGCLRSLRGNWVLGI